MTFNVTKATEGHLEDQKLSWPCEVHGKMWCCSCQVQVTVEGSWHNVA